jgi:hypothetical protein
MESSSAILDPESTPALSKPQRKPRSLVKKDNSDGVLPVEQASARLADFQAIAGTGCAAARQSMHETHWSFAVVWAQVWAVEFSPL